MPFHPPPGTSSRVSSTAAEVPLLQAWRDTLLLANLSVVDKQRGVPLTRNSSTRDPTIRPWATQARLDATVALVTRRLTPPESRNMHPPQAALQYKTRRKLLGQQSSLAHPQTPPALGRAAGAWAGGSRAEGEASMGVGGGRAEKSGGGRGGRGT